MVECWWSKRGGLPGDMGAGMAYGGTRGFCWRCGLEQQVHWAEDLGAGQKVCFYVADETQR